MFYFAAAVVNVTTYTAYRRGKVRIVWRRRVAQAVQMKCGQQSLSLLFSFSIIAFLMAASRLPMNLVTGWASNVSKSDTNSCLAQKIAFDAIKGHVHTNVSPFYSSLDTQTRLEPTPIPLVMDVPWTTLLTTRQFTTDHPKTLIVSSGRHSINLSPTLAQIQKDLILVSELIFFGVALAESIEQTF